MMAVLVFAVFVLFACLFTPVDHDEGQYVGAVAMMRHGLPYRDFAYLQTPLQPLLFAPLAWIADGWLFPALRVVNAVLAIGAVALVWLAARRAGASDRGAFVAAIALATSHCLLFAGTVARNDALPLLLMTAGLVMLMEIVRSPAGNRVALVAGLLLGSAASAKISYGLPAASAGLFALTHWGMIGRDRILLLAIGGLVGGLPTAWLFGLAPDAAWFGIIDYSLKAPVEWRMLTGQSAMMDAPHSLARLVRFLAQGCGLVAVVAVVMAIGQKRSPVERLLDMMILAGLIAAWLPRPIYVQYLGPLLPALLVRFALLVDTPFWRRPVGQGLIGLSIFAGLAQTCLSVGDAMQARDSPLAIIARDVTVIDRLLHDNGVAGDIATLAPERVVDAVSAIDRRFVPGPFLFRTHGVLLPAQARQFHVTTSRTMIADLDAILPAAILVGTEYKPTLATPQGLDAALVKWAISRIYSAHRLPSGMILLVAPASQNRHPTATKG